MMKAVEGEGMPRLSNTFEKGNLFIQFDIVFPTALSAEAQAALLTSVPKMHKASSAADGAGVEVWGSNGSTHSRENDDTKQSSNVFGLKWTCNPPLATCAICFAFKCHLNLESVRSLKIIIIIITI